VTGQAAPVYLRVTDDSGRAVGNTSLTLRIGKRKHTYTTFNDGSLSLWGFNAQSGIAVTASAGGKVYTGVMVNGTALLTEHFDISAVTFTANADGSVTLRFTADGAGTAGIQYRVDGGTLKDKYYDNATRVACSGSLTLRGLPAGTVITAEAYGTLTPGAYLTENTQDGFLFGTVSTWTVGREWKPEGSADAVYTAKKYRNPLSLPAGAEVWYTGSALQDGMPVKVGTYTMHVRIPQGTEYLPGEYTVSFRIKPIELIIVPDPNQEKYEGMADPELTYTVRGLLQGDSVSGVLTREAGETTGNYSFKVDKLTAPEHYTIRLVNKPPVFTILPADGGNYTFYEMLHPVHQEIVKADGRKVSVLMKHQESLTITYSRIGSTVYGTDDDKARTVSPSLSYNKETDRVLLRLRTEAELNSDGGYKTDLRGNKYWSGRYFRLSWLGLRSINNIGVDAVSL